MRSAVVTAPRRVELRETPLPEPREGEVRVRVEGCGVCASDLAVWRGAPWFDYPRPPGSPGHEGWGTVDAVASGVRALREGDRVAFLGMEAYADYVLADAARAIRLPGRIGALPFPGEPLACALNVWSRARIGEGNTVAVVGVGFLGALLVELAVATGARVLALSRRDTALRAAADRGACQTFRLGEEGAIEAAFAATLGCGCDVVIEAGGVQSTLDAASRLTRIRGRLVVAGYHQDGPRRVDMQLWNWRGLDVINAHERDPRLYLDAMRRAVELVCEGVLDPYPLFTHEFDLTSLAHALQLADERPPGFLKALVLP